MNLNYFKQFAKTDKLKAAPSKEVWGYTRVSSKGQFDNNNSVERQELEARQFATKKGFIVSKIFGCTYESAKSDFTRKEFMKMIEEVRKVKNKPFAILIYKMSRFSRTGGGAIGLVHELVEKLGVHLIEVSSWIDTSTEAGKLSIYNSLLAAHKENLDRKEVTYGGMQDFVKAGNSLGNSARGYDHYGPRVKNPKFLSAVQRIVLNAEGRILQKAWGWKLEERLSDVEIVNRLKDQYGLIIYPQTISAMWRNPFYCGINVTKLSGGEPVKGNWEAMISVETFQKVQDVINGNPKKSKHLKYHPARPLTGFLICNECERDMTGYENKKKEAHYYKCQKCRGVSLNTETTRRTWNKGAHQMFSELLDCYRISPSLIQPFKIQFKKHLDYLNKEEGERSKAIMQNIKEKEIELYTLRKNYTLGKVKESEQFYNELKSELEKEIVKLQMEMGDTQRKISNLDTLLSKSLALLSNLSNSWLSKDILFKMEMQEILFPNGIKYDYKKREYLTLTPNKYFELATSLSANCDEVKKEVPTFFGEDSYQVAPTSPLSNGLILKFKEIYKLRSIIGPIESTLRNNG